MTNANEISRINITQLKDVLKHLIITNSQIQKENKVPVAANIIGHAGLGKTSTIEQVGIEFGYKPENIVLLSLASFEEIGDLIGIPVTEYEAVKEFTDDKGTKSLRRMWIKEAALKSYTDAGWKVTTNSRMSYSEPEWISGKTGPGLLVLDDYTRASQRFTQAVMDLILRQQYASWKLPEGWTILLSSNPDDGIYNVTDQDPAQKSRYLNFHLKFDRDVWADWAEQNKIDGRCINFVLMNQELIKDETPEINPRSITLFFNAISTIPDFEKSLDLIQLIGEGSMGPLATTMFTAFIHNKMDKLITVDEMLNTGVSFDKIEKKLKDAVKNGKEYRGDLAYVITTRLLNHLQYNVKDEDINDKLIGRMKEIILTDALGTDLKFVIGRKIININGKFSALLQEDELVDIILN